MNTSNDAMDIQRLRESIAQTGDSQLLEDFDRKAEKIEQLLCAQAEVVALAETQTAETAPAQADASGAAHVAFAQVLFFGSVSATVNCDAGGQCDFGAMIWGLGVGSTISWGKFWSDVSPDKLAGDCSFSIEATPVACSMQFWRDGVYLGTYAGGGFGVGATTSGGSGTWKCHS